jgi:hypothetical protein
VCRTGWCATHSNMPVLYDFVNHRTDGPSNGETFITFLTNHAKHLPRGSTLVMVRRTTRHVMRMHERG